ncbi:MAG TPA: hypothetical protein PKY81_14535 [bacterium]|nr:hypothetical protein [bacterium]
MNFDIENEKEKLKINCKKPVKFRLQWLENALEFRDKIPSNIKMKQDYIRSIENSWNEEFKSFFKI